MIRLPGDLIEGQSNSDLDLIYPWRDCLRGWHTCCMDGFLKIGVEKSHERWRIPPHLNWKSTLVVTLFHSDFSFSIDEAPLGLPFPI